MAEIVFLMDLQLFIVLMLNAKGAAFCDPIKLESLISRFLTVTEVANTVLFFSSPLASGTNGASIRVDGGSMGSIL